MQFPNLKSPISKELKLLSNSFEKIEVLCCVVSLGDGERDERDSQLQLKKD